MTSTAGFTLNVKSHRKLGTSWEHGATASLILTSSLWELTWKVSGESTLAALGLMRYSKVRLSARVFK